MSAWGWFRRVCSHLGSLSFWSVGEAKVVVAVVVAVVAAVVRVVLLAHRGHCVGPSWGMYTLAYLGVGC